MYCKKVWQNVFFDIISISFSESVPVFNECSDSFTILDSVCWCTVCCTTSSNQKVFPPNAGFNGQKKVFARHNICWVWLKWYTQYGSSMVAQHGSVYCGWHQCTEVQVVLTWLWVVDDCWEDLNIRHGDTGTTFAFLRFSFQSGNWLSALFVYGWIFPIVIVYRCRLRTGRLRIAHKYRKQYSLLSDRKKVRLLLLWLKPSCFVSPLTFTILHLSPQMVFCVNMC